MEQSKNLEKKYILAGVLVLVAVALAVVLQVVRNTARPDLASPQPQPRPTSPRVSPQPQPTGLGGEIYESVQNPVKDKLPQTNPFTKEANPVSASYKNPFE